MTRRAIGALIVLVCLGIVAPPARTVASEWVAVDSCLDAGGSFNYITMQCDTTANHPYVSFERRHPGMMHSLRTRAGICIPLGLLGFGVLAWPKRRVVG